MEKRAHSRIPFKMKAYALDAGPEVLFQSEDVSAGGVYLLGDPRVDVGSRLWLRFEVTTNKEGAEWVYPVDAEIEVVRTTRGPNGEVIGFAGRWCCVESHGDLEPLTEFLRRVLSIASGFVQVAEPRTEHDKPSYVFTFPGAGQRSAPVAQQPATVGARTGIYVVLPMTYKVGEQEYEARAVKLREHGVRIATSGPLPEVYRRIVVRIPVRQKDKTEWIELWSTVTSVRRGSGEGEGQFEVEFGLTNDPETLAAYRRIVQQLTRTLGESRGV